VWVALLWQASEGVELNLATLGAVTALLTCTTGALSLVFRQLLAAKDQAITECTERATRAEERAERERERAEREVAAERVRTDAALDELHEALGVVGGAVGHAERAVDVVRNNNSGGRR
jgi:hypothetical protein